MSAAPVQVEFGPARTVGAQLVGLPVSGRVFKSPRPTKGKSRYPSGGALIVAASGTPILAPAPGKVERAGFEEELGNFVVLQHADGSYTMYAHLMEAAAVAAGESVDRFDLLGFAGSTSTEHNGIRWLHSPDPDFQSEALWPLDSLTDEISTLETNRRDRPHHFSGDDWHAPYEPDPGGRGWMPGVELIPTQAFGHPNTRPGEMAPIAVLSQVIQGHQANMIQWALERPPVSQESAHFSIGRDGRIIQHISIYDPAWNGQYAALPEWYERTGGDGPNDKTVQIQHEGFSQSPDEGYIGNESGGSYEIDYLYSDSEPWPEEMVQASFRVHRWVLDELGLPATEDTIIGLSSVQESGVNNPGDAWPRERLLRELRAGTGTRWQPDYAADNANTRDLIDIREDVDAFARLIASKNIEPPLSVGLFGNWGSGKTFFMKRLQERIALISKNTRDSGVAQSDVAFYKHIVQIEFNAWHYVEGNLWASLVTHIFDNLALDPSDDPSELEQRQKWLLQQLEELQTSVIRASKQQQELRTELATREGELAKIKASAETDSESLKGALAALAAIGRELTLDDLQLEADEQSRLRDILDEVGREATATRSAGADFYRALDDARRQLQSTGKFLAALVHGKNRGRRWLYLVGVVMAIPGLIAGVLWMLAEQFDWDSLIARVGPALLALGGWFTTGTDWLRRQSAWFARWLERAENGKRRIEEKLAEGNKPLRDKTAEVTGLREKLAEIDVERKKKEAEIADVKNKLEKTTPGHLLKEFIAERAGSDDYRKHLGVPALIRKDFEGLSENIARLNKDMENPDKEKEATPPEVINRIVLYIDDLDRCPVDVVVRVLEAIHLLLAFPLFVVVVGVDSRWTYQCLRQHYGDLLSGDSTATPHDYLEKIFQIPFWVRPMGIGGRKAMIDGLTLQARNRAQQTTGSETNGQEGRGDGSGGDGGDDSGGHTPPSNDQDGSGNDGAGPDDTDDPGDGQIQGTGKKDTSGDDATQQDRQQGSTFELNPDSLSILPQEHRFMVELTPLLGESPRALKRFVNVYRLIKSRLPQSEQPRFTTEEGECPRYKSVMFLLAIVTGMPRLSQVFFDQFSEVYKLHRGDEQQDPNLESVLQDLGTSEAGSEAVADLSRLRAWIAGKNLVDAHLLPDVPQSSTKPASWNDLHIKLLIDDARLVARYSFRVRGI